MKRPIAQIFSQSNVLSFEPYVDSTMHILFEELDRRFVNTGDICDFGLWLQMFAFDVMGELTFSNRFGFLEKGKDIDCVMENIWRHFKAAAPVSILLVVG